MPKPESATVLEKNQSIKTKNDEKPKPRFGDYTPEDVAIDKFFYFGKKINK